MVRRNESVAAPARPQLLFGLLPRPTDQVPDAAVLHRVRVVQHGRHRAPALPVVEAC